MEVGQYRNGFYFHAANDSDCGDYDKEGEEGEAMITRGNSEYDKMSNK